MNYYNATKKNSLYLEMQQSESLGNEMISFLKANHLNPSNEECLEILNNSQGLINFFDERFTTYITTLFGTGFVPVEKLQAEKIPFNRLQNYAGLGNYYQRSATFMGIVPFILKDGTDDKYTLDGHEFGELISRTCNIELSTEIENKLSYIELYTVALNDGFDAKQWISKDASGVYTSNPDAFILDAIRK